MKIKWEDVVGHILVDYTHQSFKSQDGHHNGSADALTSGMWATLTQLI